MSMISKAEPGAEKTHAELLHESQVRKERQFNTWVSVTWGLLFFFLIYIFSGVSIFGYETINLDTEFMKENFRYIGQGLWQTLFLSFFSMILAIILALVAALGRLSKFPPFYAVSTFYVSLIRGTPLYLQIFFFFLALPQLGIVLTGMTAGVLALGLNYGAYMSEIFRAGLSSVGKGQREAAIALGMTPWQTMRRVILPQALKFAIPPIGNDFIAMTKDSALVSATGFVHEVMWRAQKVGRAEFKI
jgi:polar amino acid transport system permease protein